MEYYDEDPLGGCRGIMNGCLISFGFVAVVTIVVAVIGWRLGF